MATQKKIDTVNALADKVAKAKSIVFTEYQGIKHKQLEELRRSLGKLDAEFVVAKNRLMKRALGDKAEAVAPLLEQPNAFLFAYADEVAPLKEMLKFFKAAAMGKTKGGLLGNAALSDVEVTRLAQLPSKDIMLGQLVRQLNGPVQGLHYALSWNLNRLAWALQAVKEKKTA